MTDYNNISSSCSLQHIVKNNNVCSLQFQLDAETLSESLERLKSTLDPKSLSAKSNPEVLMALEVQVLSDDMVAMQLYKSIETLL